MKLRLKIDACNSRQSDENLPEYNKGHVTLLRETGRVETGFHPPRLMSSDMRDICDGM